MKSLLRIIAVAIGGAGFIFFFQGIGIIGGSFMTSQSKWAVIGAIQMAIAILLWWRASVTKR
jgi:hypothetical protein